MGILPLSLVSWPIVSLVHAVGLFSPYEKIVALIVVRATLCATTWAALIRFKTTLCERFPRAKHLGRWFVVITTCQFHLIFYMSRTLPNTFGLCLVTLAMSFYAERRNRWRETCACLAVATLIFRCDTLLLCAPVGLAILFARDASFVSFVAWALACFGACVALTVAIDSFFWNRWVWPEFDVFYFNAVLNKSSEWGTSPFHWYLTSALPRGLLASATLVPVGLVRPAALAEGSATFSWRNAVDRDACRLIFPAVVFVALYSYLPHKELRFILPVFPVFNAIAALGATKLQGFGTSSTTSARRDRSVVLRAIRRLPTALVVLSASVCPVFLAASYRNYPGGEAMFRLHELGTACQETTPCLVHIDAAAATTGVSRFLERDRSWVYSKNESLTRPEEFASFTFLLTESPETHASRFTARAAIEKFHRVNLTRRGLVDTKPYIYVMERRREGA